MFLKVSTRRRRSKRLKAIRRVNYKTCVSRKDKQEVVSEDGTLHLYIEPKPLMVDRPCLEGLSSVELNNLQTVMVEICNRPYSMLVDSGSNLAYMDYDIAKEMGLDKEISEFETIVVNIWSGPQTLNVGILDDIPVTFKEGVTIPMDFVVCPSFNGLTVQLIMDNSIMWREGTIQTFRQKRSTLHFNKDDNNPRRYLGSARYLIETHFRKDRKDPSLSMLVDSGAEGSFYLTAKSLTTIMNSSSGRMPKRVKIHLGNGEFIMEENLRAIDAHFFDFVFGSSLLGKANSALDYGKHLLYLKQNDKDFQIKLLQDI